MARDRAPARIYRAPRPADPQPAAERLTPDQTAKIIDAAIENAVKSLTSQQAHFSKNDLLRDVFVATVAQGIAPRQIHDRIEETLKQERFVDLGQRQRFTTQEIFHEIEQKALETAERLGEKTSRTVRDRTIAREIAREPRLNDGQKAAIETVCRGPDLTYIQGPPGSGKSTLFEVARRAIEKDGGDVIGITPSNWAARELEKSSGIQSFTIHRFLYDRDRTIADIATHHGNMLAHEALGLPTWKQPKLEFALQDGEVQIGLVCSEKQAIDATLESLAAEDSRFCPVADLYWNARGGSATDGGSFIFSLEGKNGHRVLTCHDKFGKPKTVPWHQRPWDGTRLEITINEDSELSRLIRSHLEDVSGHKLFGWVKGHVPIWSYASFREALT